MRTMIVHLKWNLFLIIDSVRLFDAFLVIVRCLCWAQCLSKKGHGFAQNDHAIAAVVLPELA